MRNRSLTIVFSGMVAADPHQGGATWAVLQYVLGLRGLGHDVYLVEPLPTSTTQSESEKQARQASYFREVVSQFGLEERASLLLPGEGERDTAGLPYQAVREVCREADIILNVSGMLADAELLQHAPVRAYVDLDPAFVQLWAAQGIDMRMEGHTHFVTVGLELGSTECRVPTCGKRWITTKQPVVLDYWDTADEGRGEAFTTIGNWRGYGSVEMEGEFLGQKAHSMRELLELPAMTRERLALAMSIHSDERPDLEALQANEWCLVDPRQVASTPDRYQQFIRESKGEFGVAKSGYVKSRCGWFSDRSVCYLASGRPVIAQDTGFSKHLPVGDGLLSFTNTWEAAQALDEVSRNYDAHRQAARQIAENEFDSKVVLPRLLAELGASN